MQQAAPVVTEERERREVMARAVGRRTGGTLWVVFADLIPFRAFFECGILDSMRAAFPERLCAVFLVDEKHVTSWAGTLEGIPVVQREDVLPVDVSLLERRRRRLNKALDRRVGFYPLAIRHSLRHGFHEDRWAADHTSPFLDPTRVGPLPRWAMVERLMTRWHFSPRRYVPSALLRRMRSECDALLVTNPQAYSSMPVLTAARRLRIPAIGYIASWDHPVGKGIVSPYLDRYIVQNEMMQEDLCRFHGIGRARVSVTGWPQTDVYLRRRPRSAFDRILRDHGLPSGRPVVLFAGNVPNNAPYEGELVTRLVTWWRETSAHERLSLVFRPHPFDRNARERFSAAIDAQGVAVQRPTRGDFEELVTLLQHVDCVVANAGTILLEALVNDRPSVCVTFDEGAPDGSRWASTNLTGYHYRELLESSAFYRVAGFDELVRAIDRALQHPEELRPERRRVADQVLGTVDGRAVERIVRAVEESVPHALVAR